MFQRDLSALSAKTSGLSDWLAMDPNTPADLVNNAIYIYMMEVTACMADATDARLCRPASDASRIG